MKNKMYSLFIILFFLLPCMNAQESGNGFKFDPNKLVFGGDIGFGISKNYWTVGVSPQVGYKLSNKLIVGAGLGYRYGKEDSDYYFFDLDNDDNNTVKTGDFKGTESSVSANLFAHYFPWKKLVFSVKPEIMHTWYKGEFVGLEKWSVKKIIPAVTVGGGVYLKPIILQLNYELIQNDYSPYSDNIFLSVGFML